MKWKVLEEANAFGHESSVSAETSAADHLRAARSEPVSISPKVSFLSSFLPESHSFQDTFSGYSGPSAV